MRIRDMQRRAHETAKFKGWYQKSREAPELIALCHSELSEALEEARLGRHADDPEAGPGHKPVGMGVELADCVIRIADMCEYFGIDLETAIEDKMTYNETREFRHGGKKF